MFPSNKLGGSVSIKKTLPSYSSGVAEHRVSELFSSVFPTPYVSPWKNFSMTCLTTKSSEHENVTFHTVISWRSPMDGGHYMSRNYCTPTQRIINGSLKITVDFYHLIPSNMCNVRVICLIPEKWCWFQFIAYLQYTFNGPWEKTGTSQPSFLMEPLQLRCCPLTRAPKDPSKRPNSIELSRCARVLRWLCRSKRRMEQMISRMTWCFFFGYAA